MASERPYKALATYLAEKLATDVAICHTHAIDLAIHIERALADAFADAELARLRDALDFE